MTRWKFTVLAPALATTLLLGCADRGESRPDETARTPALSAEEQEQRAKLQKVFASIFEVPEDVSFAPELLEPSTPEHAQNIVRSDNAALFPRADAFFTGHLKKHPDDLANQTWHAQLFLAWADSSTLTAKTLATSVERLGKQRDKLSGQLEAGELSGVKKLQAEQKLDELAWLLPLTEEMQRRLLGVAADKLEIGKQKTEAILAKHADTYEGYRLAADLARIGENWEGYGEAVRQLEQHNPDSNGLRFLRGVVAFARDKNYSEAEQYLGEAVAKDPKFTKAQYYLALSHLNRRQFEEAVAALDKTLEISPGHPFSNAVRSYITRVRGY